MFQIHDLGNPKAKRPKDLPTFYQVGVQGPRYRLGGHGLPGRMVLRYRLGVIGYRLGVIGYRLRVTSSPSTYGGGGVV